MKMQKNLSVRRTRQERDRDRDRDKEGGRKRKREEEEERKLRRKLSARERDSRWKEAGEGGEAYGMVTQYKVMASTN